MELHTVYWCLPCGGCAPKGRACAGRCWYTSKECCSWVPYSLENCQIFNWGPRDRTFRICVGSLRQRKVRKIFQSRKKALGKFLCQSFVHSYPFGSSLILMDERSLFYLLMWKNIWRFEEEQCQSSSMMFSGSQMRYIMSRATVIPDSATEERRS